MVVQYAAQHARAADWLRLAVLGSPAADAQSLGVQHKEVNMAKPAPYSNTDAAEEMAVVTLRSLLDPKRAKADIRTRDKYPNVDGTIELVDQENRPFGKFDIQVKKIGDGQKSYSCPTSLVSYSEVSTLPVILACVDVPLHQVYWRHITPTMPEYRSDQDSFTIHFDETSDCIASDGIYIQKWEEIIFEFRKRITDFPKLQREIADKLTVKNLPSKDIRLFQQYIDTINRLLDDDFLAIKKILFPDVWKLGVGVFDTSEQWVSFQIYKIPYEEPAPLVCKLEGNPFHSSVRTPYAISTHGTQRGNLADPETSAKSFVLDKVKQVVGERLLPVHGQLTSIDILFSFVDHYYHLLAISPNQDSYNIEELSYALNQHMLRVCASIASSSAQSGNHFVSLNLESVANHIRSNKVEPIPPSAIPVSFSISSRHFPIKSVFDALRNIVAADIKTIKRPFIRKNSALLPGANWIWSGYNPDDEIQNITLMLENAIPEYSEFIQRNRLKLPESRYLDKSTSIIMEYVPTFTSGEWGPGLREHHLRNQSQTLPKFAVSIRSDEKSYIDMSAFPQVTYNGDKYEAITSSDSIADFFFSNTPMLNLLYRMLTHDLSEHYGISLFSSRY